MNKRTSPPSDSAVRVRPRFRRWMPAAGLAVLLYLLAVTAFAPGVAAQAPDPAGDPAPAAGLLDMGEGVPTVEALFMTSPYINGTLLGLSVLAVLLFLYLLLSMAGNALNPPRFINNVTNLILNRQFDQAVNLCQNHGRLFSASVIQRIVENHDKSPDVLMEVLSAEGRRRGEVIWNRIGYLAEISNIAPMIGLLGTVIGMMKVFFTLTTRTVGEKAAQLSGGIAEAMGTTMFGLIVAIAAGVFYTIIKGRATASLTEAEHVCHTIADHTYRAAHGHGEARAFVRRAGPHDRPDRPDGLEEPRGVVS